MVCVDAHFPNIQRTSNNMERNDVDGSIWQCAIAKEIGTRQFSGQSNGRLIQSGGVEVQAKRLVDIMPQATVVKLDIEGAEFEVLPNAVDDLYQCHTWIVEAHPNAGNPTKLVALFQSRGFDVLHVDRHQMRVREFVPGTIWDTQSTIIARRA